MATTEPVTWKQVGVVVSLMSLLGGGAVTAIFADVRSIKQEQQTDRQNAVKQEKSLGVIEEKVRRLEDDSKEIKSEIKDQNRKLEEQSRKLDELLRRTR